MNRSKLKTYAPRARRDFIKAVTDRAGYYGLTAKKIESVKEEGDVAIIAGKPFPRRVASMRKKLEKRVERQGFEQVMEAMAYTWFNRFMAIRYMELHGYLDHGYRVLSHPEDKPTPEILEHAQHVDLPGLHKQEVIDLKLDGTKEAELYQMLLLAQCRALHRAMPFLFEAIDDETELLLPDNLLHSDSLIRKMVGEIDEEDWQEVEIVGWLYQFYISEKKDEVIGKVVKSEDIPAATQLFTPNWIVKYLVQNSLGRQWMATYPDSPLKGQMEYYIEPAEQTPEVEAQLKEITPQNLDPEKLTLLDPACGSGHILVEAYDLLKAIYQERGYRRRDIPQKILRNNLFGLEIDERAAQLASFALLMKARADDRRIFEGDDGPWMNIRCIRSSDGLNAGDIFHALTNVDVGDEPPSGEFAFMDEIKRPLFAQARKQGVNDPAESFGFTVEDIKHLLSLFRDGAAETFGSLIRVPVSLAEKLPAIAERADYVAKSADKYFARDLAEQIAHISEQALLLAQKYGAAVANPPYMGGKYFSKRLKDYVASEYKDAKADLYACFIFRNLAFTKPNGFVGMITIPNWMFLSSFERIRKSLFEHQTIDTFMHNGRGVFGSDFGSCSFVYRNSAFPLFRGTFRRLFDKQGSVATVEELEHRFFTASGHVASTDDLQKVPGCPIAYWLSPNKRQAFARYSRLAESTPVRQGVATADDARFLRLWFEIAIDRLAFNCSSRQDAVTSKKRWFPIVKGGPFRKWYGNHEHVVNWESDGQEIRGFVDSNGKQRSRPQNVDFYFRAGLSYSNVSIAAPSFRILEPGFIFSHVGQALFPTAKDRFHVLAFLNSKVATDLLTILSPTTHFEVGHISALPLVNSSDSASTRVAELITGHREDWSSFETSWDFQSLPVVHCRSVSLQQSQDIADARCLGLFARMKALEEENNRVFIEAYGLENELTPEISEDQITLYRPDRVEDIQRLVSYAIGCMMGRYSLDKLGLIYANSGNQGFDSSQYRTFPTDDDGIIPVTDTAWFDDDAANRLTQFISVAWPEQHLQENLTFIAESLSPKKGEAPRDTIRRYLSQGFFKHHMKMYKKRPIYWLFSSGKAKAFECLVYLHRYNEGTLSRMRTEYVIPLQGKIDARIDQLKDDIDAATSTAHGKKLQKERDKLIKQQAELQTFDEKLRHYADQRIVLDLDDGVKVNYGKFGDLLAEVKAIHGKKP